MHDNHQYGFDPHDDSDYLTIANNEVYNNVNHGIIASKRCNNDVKIYENEVYNGDAQAAGIFLHRSSDSCEVYVESVQAFGSPGRWVLFRRTKRVGVCTIHARTSLAFIDGL